MQYNSKKPSASIANASGYRSRRQLGIHREDLVHEEDSHNPGQQRVMHPEINFKLKSALNVPSSHHLHKLCLQAHTNQLTQPKLRTSVQHHQELHPLHGPSPNTKEQVKFRTLIRNDSGKKTNAG